MKKEKHAQYFEAILQLRPATEEVINYVKRYLDKHPDVFVSKEVPLKKVNGLDVYLSDQKFTKALGQKMKRHFKGSEVKITRSLYGKHRMTSKNIYRLTVLFRLKEENQSI